MKILVFAPHNDDEVLGVGGTISKYASKGHDVYICEVTSGIDEKRVKQIQDEALEAHKILGVKETIFLGLPVVGLADIPTKKLNKAFYDVVEKIKPNIVYIPHRGDMHIDHRITVEGAMVALRPFNNPQLNAIYAYETLSETEWNIPTADNAFIPNVWSDVTGFIEIKKKAMACYRSQIQQPPHPRSNEIIETLARLRGSTIGVSYAESFMLIRKIF